MTFSPNLRHEFITCLHAIHEGTTQVGQSRRVAQLLTQYEEARQLYLDHVALFVALQWTLRQQPLAIDLPADAACPASVGGLPGIATRIDDYRLSNIERVSLAPRRRGFWRIAAAIGKPVTWSILACGVLFAAYIALISWGILDRGRHADQSVAQSARDASLGFVATIRDTVDVQWSRDTDKLEIRNQKSEISAGEPLSITSGLVELTLKQGVELVVQGPASWSITAENAARLDIGRMVAKVPPNAIGFTVHTPYGDVVDLGTEFGVEVQPGQNTQVDVFRGLVQIDRGHLESRSGPNQPTQLVAGQSATMSSRGVQTGVCKSTIDKFLAASVDAAQTDVALTESGNRRAIFQQGASHPFARGEYTGCEDVQLLSWAPTDNFGRRPDFSAGGKSSRDASRSLIRFDVTSLAGRYERIERITLRLNQTHAPLHAKEPGHLQLHLLSPGNAGWVSGTGMYSPNRIADGANWFQRAPGKKWHGANGASRAGVDYKEGVLAQLSYQPNYTNRSFDFEIKDLASIVAWIEHPQENIGFLLKTETEYANNRIAFHSSEATVAEARPALIIEYVPKQSN